MYTRVLIPLDGSKVAGQVLPYARFFARRLKIPVELLGVIDPDSVAPILDPATGHYVDTVVAERQRNSASYLRAIAPLLNGVTVRCAVEKGKPEEVVIEKAAADKETLIAMATHGRSGVQRWLLGSVAEKVLRGATNHLLLVRASNEGKIVGEANLKTVVVPLDGSKLAEKVLPYVVYLANAMNLEVILVRAYALPMSAYYDTEDYVPNYEGRSAQLKEEAREYLELKVNELKKQGLEKVSSALFEGSGADKIIELAQKTPDNFIAMCTHGRSGIKRWVLGSVTEKVVRHSGDPVLVIRAQTEDR